MHFCEFNSYIDNYIDNYVILYFINNYIRILIMINKLDWQFEYILSDKIECDRSKIIQNNNIEFQFESDSKYLIGFKLIIKNVSQNEAFNKANIRSTNLTNIITLKARQYVYAIRKSSQGIPRQGGIAPISKSSIHKFTIETKLSDLDVTKKEIQKILHDGLDTRKNRIISELSKSILYSKNGLYHENIKSLFMIIEKETKFPNYEKYATLRNVLTHPAPQYQDTVSDFDKLFGQNYFDYVKYDLTNNYIIIDLQSNKTMRKLNDLIKQILSEIRKYFKISV